MWYTTVRNPSIALIKQGYHILAEYNLVKEELKNIYAIPSYACGLHWFGVIFVHSGIYAGSVFRFSILLPDNFPVDISLPTVVFSTAVLHPHICPQNKTLDLAHFLNEWRKDEHHIWHPYCAERHLKFMDQLKSPCWKEATSMDCSQPSQYLGHIDSSRQLDEEEANQVVKLHCGRVPEPQREAAEVSL
ncbi:GD25298 [Drosophila simulans]|uniref:Protein crossbronx-like n=1 Tax=Drosophila simulans TaxID=7240 RepID=AKTP2_DROSI|nr:RecName: Full=Protein crossbronx-like [Drosophila simulans]EDX07873.1 GD25298 [Drosophila simulans]